MSQVSELIQFYITQLWYSLIQLKVNSNQTWHKRFFKWQMPIESFDVEQKVCINVCYSNKMVTGRLMEILSQNIELSDTLSMYVQLLVHVMQMKAT